MKFVYFLIPILLILSLSACKFSANFTGGTVDANIKTISIANFANEASLGSPTIAQQFTQQLRNRFQSQSRLTFKETGADVQLSGAIVGYSITPVAIQGGSSGGASQNRLEIRVKVKFENQVNPSESWEKEFKSFVDAASSLVIAGDNERTLVEQVNDQLTQDVFSASLGKW